MDAQSPQTLDREARRALVRRYADGELTLRDLRDAGLTRVIEILADIDELGLRLPLADMVGPNVGIRQAGIDRLARALRP